MRLVHREKSPLIPGPGNQTKCRLFKVKKKICHLEMSRARKCLAVGAVTVESQVKLMLLQKTLVEAHVYFHTGL